MNVSGEFRLKRTHFVKEFNDLLIYLCSHVMYDSNIVCNGVSIRSIDLKSYDE